jgi:hypothetical protein
MAAVKTRLRTFCCTRARAYNDEFGEGVHVYNSSDLYSTTCVAQQRVAVDQWKESSSITVVRPPQLWARLMVFDPRFLVGCSTPQRLDL